MKTFWSSVGAGVGVFAPALTKGVVGPNPTAYITISSPAFAGLAALTRWPSAWVTAAAQGPSKPSDELANSHIFITRNMSDAGTNENALLVMSFSVIII